MNKLFDNFKTPLKGVNLIEASAGTGKTYSIATLYLRLLLEKELPVESILVTTYTEAATAELRERIRTKIQSAAQAFKCPAEYVKSENFLQDELILYLLKEIDVKRAAVLLENALRNFDEAAVYTIHGFCQRALKDHAFESGSIFNFELLKDQSAIIEEICNDFWRKEIFTASPLLVEYLYVNKIARADLISQFNVVANKPLLKISPSVKQVSQCKLPSSKNIYELYEKLQDIWKREKGDILNYFLNSENLNRKSYKLTNIHLYILEMDQYLFSKSIFSFTDSLKKFSSSFIKEKGSKKNFQEDELTCTFFFVFNRFYKFLLDIISGFESYLIRLKREFIVYMQDELFKRKQKGNLRSFDDLLIDFESALCGVKGKRLLKVLRIRYRAAMIDEFQDTDLLQYRIFSTIFNTADNILFFIGDPKQAIYSFRGADIFAYLKAVHDADKKYLLYKNWRSHKDLIGAINALFKRRDSFVFKEIDYNEAVAAEKDDEFIEISGDNNRPFKLWFLRPNPGKDKSEIAAGQARAIINQQVRSEIARILNLGNLNKASIINVKNKTTHNIKAGDIAVLVRTHAEARDLHDLLTESKIPSIIQSRESVFKSTEMNELYILLQAIAEPAEAKYISAALATDIMGASAGEIYGLMQDEDEWSKVLLKFEIYHQLWERTSFINMFRRFLVNEKIKPRLAAGKNGSRKITNILQLVEIFQKAAVDNGLGIKGLLNWINKKISNPDSNDESELRLETDEDAVQIVTIHASKGLQYPIVFCPFCWKGLASGNKNGKDGVLFHDKDGFYCIDLEGEKNMEFTQMSSREILAENIRLLYVALTRAKYRTYLVWGKIRGSESSAPAYLFNYNNYIQSSSEDFNLNSFFDYVKELSWDELYSNLQNQFGQDDSCIDIQLIPSEDADNDNYVSALAAENRSLVCRNFKRKIYDKWKITSYSFLVSGAHLVNESYDYYQEGTNKKSNIENEPEKTIFTFPAGAEAGLALHEIFENIDFYNCSPENSDQLVKDVLTKHNFKNEWQEVIVRMVFNVLGRPLVTEWGNILLKNIEKNALCKEMEFYFPMSDIDSKRLTECFDYHSDKISADFIERVSNLNFKEVEGFLKGFIDLVFEHEGRYYIVDWKSNYLGDSFDDYEVLNIERSMLEHLYHLQYYIYTVAVHRYLEIRIKNYNYQKHFGGIFYIYLRGVNRNNLMSGVFADRPDENLIKKLTNLLVRK